MIDYYYYLLLHTLLKHLKGVYSITDASKTAPLCIYENRYKLLYNVKLIFEHV